MANPNQGDIHDTYEGSEHSNDDFEKLDNFYNDGTPSHDHDGADAAGAGALDSDQDAEISTTTDNAGEEETEEIPYIGGASEADAYVNTSNNLVDLGFEAYDEGIGQDDHFRAQPSAPVPDEGNVEPLIDFNSSTGPDVLPSMSTPVNEIEEQISSTSNPLRHFEVGSSVEPEKSGSKEQTSVQSSEDPTFAAEAPSLIKPTDESTAESETIDSVLEQTSLNQSANQGSPERIGSLQSQLGLHKALNALGCWLKGVDPRVKDLIYWRCPKTTGIVFGGMLVMLISLSIFSFLSVVAYLALATLSVTFSYVTYKKIMAAVQKSGDGHPFKQFLEMDIEVREDKLKSAIQQILKNLNATGREVRRLFLIEDTVDSIKFGLLLWLLTYIGAWFNGMTLIIIGLVLVFSVPKVYETYQVQIDNYLGLAKAQVDNVFNIVQSKVPFLKKKEKAQ